jgi:hypothetical protein
MALRTFSEKRTRPSEFAKGRFGAALPSGHSPTPRWGRRHGGLLRLSERIGAGATIFGMAVPQIGSHRLLHGERHPGAKNLPRNLRGSAIRFEETDAVGTVPKMSSKIRLIVLGQITLDVIEAEIDELLTVDHAVTLRSLKQSFDGRDVSRLRDITCQTEFAKDNLRGNWLQRTETFHRRLSAASRCQIITSLDPPDKVREF